VDEVVKKYDYSQTLDLPIESCNVSEVRRMIEIGLGIGLLPIYLAAPYEQS